MVKCVFEYPVIAAEKSYNFTEQEIIFKIYVLGNNKRSLGGSILLEWAFSLHI